MTHARRVIVSVLGAMLLAAPLVRAQEVKANEAKVIVMHPLPIAPRGGQHSRALDGLPPAASVSTPSMGAHDLSLYRDFHFGETLPAVAKQAGLEMSGVKLIHEHPAVMQELEWPIWLGTGSAPQTDPVKTVLFSFYNGELYRILVTYDRDETAGLTTEDMIDAISSAYGTATKPVSTEIAFSSDQVYNESELILARWEDAQFSFNLFRSSFQPTFGVIAFSKRLDALARAATGEANRLDAQTAPQRELQREQREDEENRESLEKARQANKSNFRL
jgi:hypothetical protein